MIAVRKQAGRYRTAGATLTQVDRRTANGAGASRLSAVATGLTLSEADLVSLWEGQSFPAAALQSRDGRRFVVVHRGRRTGGPGPDFRDSIIATSTGLLRGDVELHVRASDFRRHGHSEDPAYGGVVLHVVLWDDDGPETRLPGGARAPVAALGVCVERRADEKARSLGLPGLEEPCHQVGDRLGAAGVAVALERLALLRFREKVSVWRQRLREQREDDLLWQGLLEGLGYGGQRGAFQRLAVAASWTSLVSRLANQPSGRRLELARQELLRAWSPDVGVHCRPGNESWRRLEGAALLAVRFADDGPCWTMVSILRGEGRASHRRLLAALTVRSEGKAFIGRGRAVELAANAVLPWAAASVQGLPSEQAEEMYLHLPRPARYGAVRHLESVASKAGQVSHARQQGMLHLVKEFCRKGGCGGCPLS